MSRAGGNGGGKRVDVLFVCVHNAGRSQMAAAAFNQIARRRGLRLRAESAGTMPAERVHENVKQAMAEIGIDLTDAHPRLLTNDLAESASRIVTMGCEVDRNSCPTVFIKGVEDWGLPDPAHLAVELVRPIRDEVIARVRALIAELDSLERDAADR
jgi:arsenate reductase